MRRPEAAELLRFLQGVEISDEVVDLGGLELELRHLLNALMGHHNALGQRLGDVVRREALHDLPEWRGIGKGAVTLRTDGMAALAVLLCDLTAQDRIAWVGLFAVIAAAKARNQTYEGDRDNCAHF